MKDLKVAVCRCCKRMTFTYNMHGDICVFCYSNHEDKKMIVTFKIEVQTDFRDDERNDVMQELIVEHAKQLAAAALMLGDTSSKPKTKVTKIPFMRKEVTVPVVWEDDYVDA